VIEVLDRKMNDTQMKWLFLTLSSQQT